MRSGNASPPESALLLAASEARWRSVLRHIRRWPILSVVILTTLVFAAVTADLIAPHDPVKATLSARRAPPMWEEGGSSKFILGGDLQGRDVLSRIIHGARVSLMVAGSSILIGMVFGTTYGLISGYFGGWLDEALMRIVEIFLAIPLIMAALVILVVAGRAISALSGCWCCSVGCPFARQVRAETLAIKVLDYVALARVAGAPTHRILINHILPGVAEHGHRGRHPPGGQPDTDGVYSEFPGGRDSAADAGVGGDGGGREELPGEFVGYRVLPGDGYLSDGGGVQFHGGLDTGRYGSAPETAGLIYLR